MIRLRVRDEMKVRVVFVGQMGTVGERKEWKQTWDVWIERWRGKDVWRMSELDHWSELADRESRTTGQTPNHGIDQNKRETYEMMKVNEQDSQHDPV